MATVPVSAVTTVPVTLPGHAGRVTVDSEGKVLVYYWIQLISGQPRLGTRPGGLPGETQAVTRLFISLSQVNNNLAIIVNDTNIDETIRDRHTVTHGAHPFEHGLGCIPSDATRWVAGRNLNGRRPRAGNQASGPRAGPGPAA